MILHILFYREIVYIKCIEIYKMLFKMQLFSFDFKICNREYNSIKFNSLPTHLLLISTEWL